MALGSSYKRIGQKRDLVVRIQLELSYQGKGLDFIATETKKIQRMSTEEVQQYYSDLLARRRDHV
jgi:hypothetical protein